MNNREIKRRIASVKETVKITRAMHAISVAKMMKGRALLPVAERFEKACRDVMDSIAYAPYPYFKDAGDRIAFIVIGGDKGLCGDYNARVFECAYEALSRTQDRYLFTVGSVVRDMLGKAGMEADMEFLHSAENPSPEASYSMAADLINLFDEGMLDEIYLVYSKVTDSHYEPIVERLLPYLPKGEGSLPQEGVTEQTVKRAIYQYLSAAIYRALISSALAEHLARVKAMPLATENGEAMIADLTAKYHKVRQESITRAMQDVSGLERNYEQSV